MVIQAADLLKKQVKQDPSEDLAVERVLEQTEKHVLYCSEQGHFSAHLSVPSFLLGVPVFKRELVFQRVMGAFKESGYAVHAEGEDRFMVSWKQAKVQEEEPEPDIVVVLPSNKNRNVRTID